MKSFNISDLIRTIRTIIFAILLILGILVLVRENCSSAYTSGRMENQMENYVADSMLIAER